MIPFSAIASAAPFSRFVDRVAQRVRGVDPFRRGLTLVGVEYLNEQRRRFREQANGAGEWRELAKFTKIERRRLGFSPERPILIRLGVLYNALNKGEPGNVFRIDNNGLSVGFGGNAQHPGYESDKPRKSIAEIARIQHDGRGRVPIRRLMVPPSPAIRRLAARELGNDLRSIYAESSRA